MRPPWVGVRDPSDSGSATVLVLVVAGAVMACATALGIVALVILGQHRAASVADLAALSAAQHLFDAPGSACLEAQAVAASNHARLLSCHVADDSATVSVGLDPTHTWLDRWFSQIVGRAKAGYVSTSLGSAVRPASVPSSTRTAPALSSGSLPLPHFGD